MARTKLSKEPAPTTERVVKGLVVPTPTFPVLMTAKRVEVAKAAVEEEMMKSVGLGGNPPEFVVVELAWMEK